MEEKMTVEMTSAERELFKQWQAEQARKEAAEKAQNMRATYVELVDKEIESIMPELVKVSGDIAAIKKKTYENFKAIIAMKEEMYRLRTDEKLLVQSHTFTNTKGNMRVTLGAYQVDYYKDTAEEGIAIVKGYISSLAKDEDSKALVDMVLKLLAKDAKGTLKASRILQLRRLADKIGDERFVEGVKIIEDAYDPQPSKTYIKAEVKDDKGAWKNIPLGMTES